MRKILVISFVCLFGRLAVGQTDSLTTSKSEPDSIDIKYDRLYKLFVEENNQEIRHLFKLDLMGLTLLEPTIAFEQKLGKSFSSETGLGIGLTNIYYNSPINRHIYLSVDSYSNDGNSIGGYEMVKYYYNLKRRQRLAKNINGFAGNYFAIHYAGMYFFNNKNDRSPVQNKYVHAMGITYGLQRRIGNIGYIEPSVTLIFRHEKGWGVTGEPSFNLKMGFAIESLGGLQKMLKK